MFENRDRVTYEISPNEYDFKNATRDIINGLETSVGKDFIRFCLE
jgi:hypothetical protein